MSVEGAESAAIRVTLGESGFLYELRWYSGPDFVVPMWWVGIIDLQTDELGRTDVLHPAHKVPGEVFRWLVPIVGNDVARQLVTLAAKAILPKPVRTS
jgi:hypothetical protein